MPPRKVIFLPVEEGLCECVREAEDPSSEGLANEEERRGGVNALEGGLSLFHARRIG